MTMIDLLFPLIGLLTVGALVALPLPPLLRK